MPLDEFATEKKPKPCSRDLTGARILCPYKTPKNMGLLSNRNANASIANGNERSVWLDFFTDGQFDGPSLRAVLDGIAQQVGEHLLDALTVDLHHEGGVFGVEGERVLLRGHLSLCHHMPGQGHEIRRGARQDQPSCLQARHIEQILGEFIQARGRHVNFLEGLCLPGARCAPLPRAVWYTSIVAKPLSTASGLRNS